MLAAMGVILVGMAVFLWEGRTLLKKKKKKELVIFTLSLLLAVTLNIAIVLHVPLPTLAHLIEKLLSPVVNPIVSWIEGETA